MEPHTLVIVGTGINGVEHLHNGARAWLASADRVFYLVADPATESIIQQLSPNAASLAQLYDAQIHRHVTYRLMVDVLLSHLLVHPLVCAAFYGHPCVFVDSARQAVRRAREAGFRALVVPAVSAEDCLFADLGLDPGRSGCQSFEVTDFLVVRRQIDTSCPLILWQISALGILTGGASSGPNQTPHLSVLAEVLTAYYGADHQAVIYEAATLPLAKPRIEPLPIRRIPEARVTSASTLYVPPNRQPTIDATMLRRLGIEAATAPPEVPRGLCFDFRKGKRP